MPTIVSPCGNLYRILDVDAQMEFPFEKGWLRRYVMVKLAVVMVSFDR